MTSRMRSAQEIQAGLAAAGYLCSRQMAQALFIAAHLEKPILVEGPAGVGKTELAKATAACLGLPLIRLQCYEGLDESKALYEWKYGKQLLYTQILRSQLAEVLGGADGLAACLDRLRRHDDLFFSIDFLESRPLLQALQKKEGAVLLIDEIDKSDPEFEAFLLEVLSDFQVSIPEIGTIRAQTKPFVFLTSNNSREMSEPLKRRCLHLFIPLPDRKLEMEIIRARVPGLPEELGRQLVAFIQELRLLDLKKLPSVSESIDWAKTLVLLHATRLEPTLIRETLNVIVKFEEDLQTVRERLPELGDKATRSG